MAAFSLKRFNLLLKKQISDNWKIAILAFIGVAGLMIITEFGWYKMSGIRYEESTLYSIYTYGLFILGCTLGSITFSDTHSNNKGISWFMLPATLLEKLLSVLLFNTVIFFILYTAVFAVTRPFFVNLAINEVIHSNERYANFTPYKVFDQGIFNGYECSWVLFFSVQLFFMLGSVVFKKYAFIKTLLSAFLLIISYILFVEFLHKDVFNIGKSHNYHWELFKLSIYPDKTDFKRSEVKIYKVPDYLSSILSYVLTIGGIPILFYATYLKLREKEL